MAQRVEHLLPSGIRKVNEKAMALERAGEDIIHFEIGRPDFDTPESIKAAAVTSLAAGDVFYTSNYGKDSLREEIARKLLRENNVSYEPAEILVTIGASEAVFCALFSILDEGSEILVPDPIWMNYRNIPLLLNAKPVSYSLDANNGFCIDLDDLRSQITPKTRALILVSPNNPTGSVLSKEQLLEIARLAAENDIWVISDEIYEKLIYDGLKHVSVASLPGMKERTVTINGFSKAFSMTGWRVGYAAAPKHLIEAMNKVHQHVTICAPSFAQSASVSALRDEQTAVLSMVAEYQRRRDYAAEAINQIPQISCVSPHGAFYLFICVKKLGYTSAWIADYLLEEAHIALVPGSVFGQGGEGYVRLSFATDFERIVEGCERMKKAIQKLTAGSAEGNR